MYIRGKKISQTSAMHYLKLLFRSALLFFATCLYVYCRVINVNAFQAIYNVAPWFLWAVSTIYIVEMCFRFMPSSMESKGCQKQFAENYIPTGTNEEPKIDNAARTAVVIISWILLNACIAALYFVGIIDQFILVLICLAYGVCDMICILFFCPFQTWMMKNKCCGTCRIYNWDYIMMFTPCLLINHGVAKVLFILAAALFAEWEYLYKKYPERFAENTNALLRCENCDEKLCSHKKQLQRYLVEFRKALEEEKEKLEHKL